MRLHYDNKAAINIVHNLSQNNKTKHVEIDWHFTKKKLENGLIFMSFIPTKEQLTDIFTKGLPKLALESLTNNLGLIDIFQSAWGCFRSYF